MVSSLGRILVILLQKNIQTSRNNIYTDTQENKVDVGGIGLLHPNVAIKVLWPGSHKMPKY